MSNLEIVAAISGISAAVLGRLEGIRRAARDTSVEGLAARGLAGCALGEVGRLLGLGAFVTVSVVARADPRLGAVHHRDEGIGR